MSLFLFSDRQLFHNTLQPTYNPQSQRLKHYIATEKAWLAAHLQGEIKKMGEVPVLVKNLNSHCVEYRYISGLIQQKYHIVECLKLNSSKRTIEMSLIFTIPSGAPFQISNMNHYGHVINKIAFRPQAQEGRLANICFNINNGVIMARFPTLYLFNHFLDARPTKTQSKLYQLFKIQIHHSLSLFQMILAGNNPEKSLLVIQNLQKKQIWQSIYRYNEMINISSHLNQSYLASEAQIRQNNRVKQNDIKRVIKNRKLFEKCIIKNSGLFEQQVLQTRSIPQSQEDFQLTRQEYGYIQYVVAMPQNQKSKNPQQNNMILNHIYIKNNMNSLQLSLVNEGGFASLFLTEIQFQYVYSSEGNDLMLKNQNSKQNTYLSKFVVVKKSTMRQHQKRIHHQIQILKQLKNGVSVLLPKYYMAVNKQCFFANSIVMDYLPFKNLKQYLQSNSVTISLITKLYLIFSITQSLRYIRDYQVVHLDVKSANIMIFCNLLIKLIDFGESYHPSVCKQKKHTPGYTIPYSSPEVYFQQQDKFTSKSDVYSLGVIIYEILYNRLPFRSSANTQVNDNIMEDYFSRWSFMPQQLEARGQVKIIRLLNMLVCKCLSPRKKDRPELDWIALIIRQCFQLIN